MEELNSVEQELSYLNDFSCRHYTDILDLQRFQHAKNEHALKTFQMFGRNFGCYVGCDRN